jgi:hypothetical protein
LLLDEKSLLNEAVAKKSKFPSEPTSNDFPLGYPMKMLLGCILLIEVNCN